MNWAWLKFYTAICYHFFTVPINFAYYLFTAAITLLEVKETQNGPFATVWIIGCKIEDDDDGDYFLLRLLNHLLMAAISFEENPGKNI